MRKSEDQERDSVPWDEYNNDSGKKRSMSSANQNIGKHSGYNNNNKGSFNTGQYTGTSFMKASKLDDTDNILSRSQDYDVQRLKKRIKLLEADLLEREKELNEEKFEKGDLRLKVSELQDTLFLLERELQDERNKSVSTERELSKVMILNGYITEMKKIAQESNPELSRCLDLMLHEEKTNWEKKMSEILSSLKEKDETLTHLENKNKHLKTSNTRLQEDYDFLSEDTHRLTLELQEYKSLNTFKDQELENYRDKMDEIELEYNRMHNDKSILQDEIQNKYIQIGALSSKDTNLLQKNIGLESELKNLKSLYENLQEKYFTAKSQCQEGVLIQGA